MSRGVPKQPVKFVQTVQVKLSSNFLVRSFTEGVGQVGELALKMLELILYLLHPCIEELIWVEWVLVAPCVDDPSIFVLVAFRVVSRSHVATASVARVVISARCVEVDELVESKLAVFDIGIVQKLDGSSY